MELLVGLLLLEALLFPIENKKKSDECIYTIHLIIFVPIE